MSEQGPQDIAFVLHTYPYQETSLIAEVFTRSHGRLGMVAKGARRPRSALRGLVQPFQALRLSWLGKGDLHTLSKADWLGGTPQPRGMGLLCAFYLNELLLKLLARADAHEQLFDVYADTLRGLAGAAPAEVLLRRFELRLLRELGYELNLTATADNAQAIQRDAHYRFDVQRGPIPAERAANGDDPLQFLGKTLLDMAADDFSDPLTLAQSKQLMRHAIAYYLNGQMLHTRQLLRDLQEF